LGELVTSIFVSSVLPFGVIDMANLEQDSFVCRVIYSLCAGAGALIAMFTDWPQTKREGVARFSTGIFLGALFIPFLGERYNFAGNINSVIAAAGAIGLVGWYVMGSASRFLRWLKTSDVVSTIIKMKTGIGPGGSTIETTTKQSASIQTKTITEGPAI
jgi:hypothetical protein